MGLRGITEGTTIADKLLLAALIIISVSGFAFIKKIFPEGTDVKIDVDGKLIYRLPLDADRTLHIKGINGDAVVEIKGGKVRVKESDCPNKICVQSGWIEKGAIVCLPNRICVTVTGNKEKEQKGVDAISG